MAINKVVADRKVSDRRDIDKMLANKLVDNEVALNNLVVDVANAMFFSLKLLICEPYYLCLSRLECQA